MSVQSGRLRDKMRFQVRAGDQDQYGNPSTAWAEYGTRYGTFRETGAVDTIFGGATQIVVRADVTVRNDRLMQNLPDAARIQFRGRWWRVVGRWLRPGTTPAERDFLNLKVEASTP